MLQRVGIIDSKDLKILVVHSYCLIVFSAEDTTFL